MKGTKRQRVEPLPVDMFNVSEELAWQTALIEGEGTITIAKRLRDGHISEFRAYIGATNTDLRLISPLSRMWGGNIYIAVDTRTEKKWADSYHWRCPMTNIGKMLTSMLPYLRAKRQQAELVLEFLRTKKVGPRLGRGGKSGFKGSAPLGPEELEHRERLRHAVRMLNTKSVYARKNLEKKRLNDLPGVNLPNNRAARNTLVGSQASGGPALPSDEGRRA